MSVPNESIRLHVGEVLVHVVDNPPTREQVEAVLESVLRPPVPALDPRFVITPEADKVIHAMYAEGKSLKEISEATGIKRQTIHTRLKKTETYVPKFKHRKSASLAVAMRGSQWRPQ